MRVPEVLAKENQMKYMKLPLLVAMALAIAVVPAFGQVTVSLGVFEGGGHDVSASAGVAQDVDLSFRHKGNKRWMQDVSAGVALSDRFDLAAGWHSHSLGAGRSDGPAFALNGNCKGPVGVGVLYGIRGYPTMDGRAQSRGAGWSVGLKRDVGKLFSVHVAHDWDRFWAVRGPNSVKMAGVSAGVTFRLGG